MDIGTHRGERRGSRVGAGEARDPVAGGDQVADDGGADEAGGASDENTHEHSPGIKQGLVETTICARIIRVK
ncbi:hypothetical protein [Bradyrhizobium sp. URHA0013]|uniref:hypothetical protein n=1 Tax=Bradyrhizobium sp. URHA0013 TaxID=1380352 RepID=UPI001FDA13D0|nr:hypothetical protein [Bradyrhizobium sp. URHA0013]